MAQEKKSNNLIYIILIGAIAYLLLDGWMNPDKSLLGFLFPKTQQSASKKSTMGMVKFPLARFRLEEMKFNRRYISPARLAPGKNPFYMPVARRTVVRKAPTIDIKITQIVDTYVEIDGNYLTVGDQIKGWTIESVNENSVTFSKDGSKATVKVGQ